VSETFGSYVLLEGLGRGGAGVVYRARHVPTGALRALKILLGPPDHEAFARFRREAETLARLGGEGVVPIHESGTEQGRPFIAMGLMSGGSLAARMKDGRPLGWREAVSIALGIARALERCHAAGIIHRDLKPANVLFDDEGRPRLADFGIVRDLGATRLTETGTLLGTPLYMPPEQLEGRAVDARADLYALGVILHELVTGQPPHRGSSFLELAREKRSGVRPELPEETPRALLEVLERALAGRVEDRHASATELVRALESVLADRPAPTRRLPLVVAAGAASIIIVASVFLLGSGAPTDAPPPSVALPPKLVAPPTAPSLRDLLAARDFDRAAERLEDALSKHEGPRPDPTLAAAVYDHSRALGGDEAWEKELRSLLLAARLDPRWAGELAARTEEHLRLDRIEGPRAIALLDAVADVADARGRDMKEQIDRSRAYVLWKAGRYAQAVDLVVRVAEQPHDDIRATSRLVIKIAQGPDPDLPQAEVERLADLLVKRADSPEAHLFRGRALRKTKPEEAIEDLRVAHEGVDTPYKKGVLELIDETLRRLEEKK